MSVLYVYNDVYDNKPITIDLTNQNTRCVFCLRNTPEYNGKSSVYGDKGTTRTCQFIRAKDDKLFIN